MGLFEHFPYTNFHELNLGWFLDKFKALLAEWGIYKPIFEGIRDEAEAAAEDAAEALAAAETAQGAAETALAQANTAITTANTAVTEAQTARDAAETAQAGAETALADAVTSKNAAEAAQNAAEDAQTASETAQAGAESALADAVTAKNAAVAAQTAAEAAQNAAEDAQTAAENAQYAAELAEGNAAHSANQAEDAADAAETAQAAAELAEGQAAHAANQSEDAADRAEEAASLFFGYVVNVSEGTDISSALNNALNDYDIVKVPEGNYLVNSTVYIPDGKTLQFSGGFHNESIPKTVITTENNGLVLFSLGNGSNVIGGYIDLESSTNTKAFVLDCHNKGIEWSSIRNSKVKGSRDINGNLTQTAVYIECDATDSTTEQGHLVHCTFDLWIESVRYAYHFHRQRAAGTTSGVWLTNNDIYGYIRHCSRYVYYDMAEGTYANNSSVIGATLQAGGLVSGESQLPGINLMGNDILVSGRCWDFSGLRNYPAVSIESTATKCFVLRDDTTVDYNTDHSLLTGNISLNSLLRTNSYKKVNVTLTSDANTNNYITNFTSKSYRIGDVIFIKLKFKIGASVPQYSGLFQIDDDAFIEDYVCDIVQESNGNRIASVLVPSASPHGAYNLTALTSNNAWMSIRMVLLSNRITTFSL